MKFSCFFRGLIVGFMVMAWMGKGAIAGDFSRFHMPVSNPVYNGDPRNITMVRPIYLYQRLPDKIELAPGVKALLKQKLGMDTLTANSTIVGI